MDPAVCSLDEQLKAFVSRHSATFSSIVKGDLSRLPPWYSLCPLTDAKVLSDSRAWGGASPRPVHCSPDLEICLSRDSRSRAQA